MKETILVSTITQDIYVETHNDYEVFILHQGEAPVVMTSGQLAQLVGVVQGSRPTMRAPDVGESEQKCTTEKLCPVHNVWHAKAPRG
jgi:hypothetical protein